MKSIQEQASEFIKEQEVRNEVDQKISSAVWGVFGFVTIMFLGYATLDHPQWYVHLWHHLFK